MLGHPWNCTMDGIWKAGTWIFIDKNNPIFQKKTYSIKEFFSSLHGLWFSIPHFQKKRWKGRKTCLTIRALTKWLLEKAFFIFFSANGSDTFFSFYFLHFLHFLFLNKYAGSGEFCDWIKCCPYYFSKSISFMSQNLQS